MNVQQMQGSHGDQYSESRVQWGMLASGAGEDEDTQKDVVSSPYKIIRMHPLGL